MTAPEKEQFISKLQEVEDWLYEDGEDETKGVYVAKLEELKKVQFRYLCYSLLGFLGHIYPYKYVKLLILVQSWYFHMCLRKPCSLVCAKAIC